VVKRGVANATGEGHKFQEKRGQRQFVTTGGQRATAFGGHHEGGNTGTELTEWHVLTRTKNYRWFQQNPDQDKIQVV